MSSAFYDAGAVRKVANTLFLGWGYSFYRVESQLRADDQLVRAKAAWLLGQAVASVQTAEADFRRAGIPAPTRANPFPDAGVLADVQALERLGRDLAALEGRLHALPAPEQDLMTLRFRQEAETLTRLIAADEQLVGSAELLRAMVAGRDGAWLLDHEAEAREGLSAIQAVLHEREAVWFGRKG
jgi:hypothetical protein